MINVTTPYLDLTPNFENKFRGVSSSKIKEILNENFSKWVSFVENYPEYTLSLYIVTKRNTEVLDVKGPTISKRYKTLDYSIFLPDEIKDLNHYIDLVFEGIGTVLTKYEVSENEVIIMRDQCKKDLEK